MEAEPDIAGDDDDLNEEFTLDVDPAVVTTAEPATAGNPGDPLESLYRFHPETLLDFAEQVIPMIPLQQVPPDQKADITELLDAHHTSQPFLTVYEKTKILSLRANQLTEARPYVERPEYVTNTLEIAKMELEQRRLPYIIKRPMPDGTFEYWRLSDLMII
jgi:DNA-directed RNA polymerase I, II, and III subunit RPABC2